MKKNTFALVMALMLIGGGFYAWRTQILPTTIPCANTNSCATLPHLEIENGALAKFGNQAMVPPQVDENLDQSQVLGEETSIGEKHIYVDLTSQTLRAFQGDDLYMEAKVSTGKWNKTPPGTYKIWIKIKATRMSGGEGADAYDLPNVPWVMFFYNDKVPKIAGYSLHGAYWHDNFGHPMSHGCVNMRQIDAEKLYNWVSPVAKGSSTLATVDDPGTIVTIY